MRFFKTPKEEIMEQFVLKADQNLKVAEENFGAYIKEGLVFVPSELFALTSENYLGDDPVALAGFLSAFPLSLASLLNAHCSVAQEKSDKFILFLEENGIDVSAIRKASNRVTERKYGALPPPAKKI